MLGEQCNRSVEVFGGPMAGRGRARLQPSRAFRGSLGSAGASPFLWLGRVSSNATRPTGQWLL